MSTLDALLAEVRACTHCAEHLPLGPRPVVRIASTARLLIIGQAPGTRVHESGIPWNDKSGERLRGWMGIDDAQFYDESKIAIMPMGFCYPGVVGGSPAKVETGFGVRRTDQAKKPNGGDQPPRPECAPLWHDRLRAHVPDVRLTLLIGQYAQKRYLGARRKKTLTETVQRYADVLEDGFLPLPHPSWRTAGWQKKHHWFDAELLPVLRERLSTLGFAVAD